MGVRHLSACCLALNCPLHSDDCVCALTSTVQRFMPKDDPPTLFSFSLPKLCVDERRQVVCFLCLTYLDSLLFFSHVWMRVPLHVCLSEMPVGGICITWPRCFLRSLNTDIALRVLQKPVQHRVPDHILDMSLTCLHPWCQSFWSFVISNLDQYMGS